MSATRLFHFSDNSDIATFVPRPVLVPAKRPPGMDWMNGPLVWAIEEAREYMYLFPRACPRIVLWPTAHTTDSDRMEWVGKHAAVVYIERRRLPEVESGILYRYELPGESFEDLNDAGMWVSRDTVVPLICEEMRGLPDRLATRNVELRVVESLAPYRPLWDTTLHVSGIRLRNAEGWS